MEKRGRLDRDAPFFQLRTTMAARVRTAPALALAPRRRARTAALKLEGGGLGFFKTLLFVGTGAQIVPKCRRNHHGLGW